MFWIFRCKKIETSKFGFKLKKEIHVFSESQYIALTKLKQLRYYVKQLN